ncbi:hypothetical protein AB0I28_22185 [Phytomonospora sp. NPDC050363]|uniref:hypothetical protein n=1 Tax=Phytomonospora sp. NPDC050363 TaxID=3155642 RepID=UPI0033CB01A6
MTSADTPDFRGKAFTDLVAWLGAKRENHIFALLADYASLWGTSGTWRCEEDIRWAVHVVGCEPYKSDELRWATNLLARLSLTADEAKGIRCRERH